MLVVYKESFLIGLLGALSVVVLLSGTAKAQDVASLEPVADNSIYEEDGALSNGSGDYLFVGNNNRNEPRRALLRFDPLSQIPEGATVDSVRLSLNLSKVAPGAAADVVAVHRLLADWGEGASDAAEEEGGGATAQDGDATWLHASYDNVLWTTPGGDFEGAASGTQTVSGLGPYTWDGAGLAADVQAWLETPGENYGWILIASSSAAQSARRFDSRESATVANRPTLTVYYTADPATATDPTPVPSDPVFTAYPTPFEGATTLSYDLPAQATVTLAVYDVLGRRMALLVAGEQAPGAHRYTWDAADRASGVYLARLEITDPTGTHAFTRLLSRR